MASKQLFSAIVFVLALFAAADSDSSIVQKKQQTWTVTFEPQNLTMHMNSVHYVNLTLRGLNESTLLTANSSVFVISDSDILRVHHEIPLHEISNGSWSGSINVSAVFLGHADILVFVKWDEVLERSDESLPVVIIREERFIDKLFTVSVAVLVSILYINFGAALDLTKVKSILIRPIGPLIAVFINFFILPLVRLNQKILLICLI